MTKTIDVAALGEAMMEFNQPHSGEPHYLQVFGGDTSNTAIAAARAAARASYLTRLGQDHFGDALLDLWRREGVECAATERDADAHTRSTLSPTANGVMNSATCAPVLPPAG
ncbi:MAG: PfkB family carbohydrate kinase [Rhodoferax sp.]